MKKFKIIFMGTTDFGAPALEQLIEDGHTILSVFCQPDRPNRRGKKIEFLPIKKLAIEKELKILQPEKINNPDIIEMIKDAKPDFLVVAAYGQKLPEEILSIPLYGALNIHGSLLPKYRGAAPIQRAIINGDNITGITIMQMAKGLDTGNMYIKSETEITAKTTFGELHKILAESGARLLSENLEKIANKTLIAKEQNENEATFAEKIDKEMGHLDWTMPGERLVSLINGLDPHPGAYFYLGDKKVKCFLPVFEKTELSIQPGHVVEADVKSGLSVAVGNGLIRIKEIQYPGKKRMAVKDFLRGNPIEIGMLFK
ncbi:methionyl-tRNA formyltransferase [Eubacteriaceae bacterium ES3]|nr:methionyl-tRNA formyltransferase [Eubacteriaceae bacterium ES3]